MTWILLLLGILEFLLPYIIKWFQSSPADMEEARGEMREYILLCRDHLGRLEGAVKNPVQRKRLAKCKARYAKVRDMATKAGVQL